MHVWKNLNAEEFTFSELNTDPIGSGPYEVRSVKKVSGIARTYTLKSFSDYAGGEPYIRTIEITSFANIQTMVDAFESGELDQISGIDSATAKQLEKMIVQCIFAPLSFLVYLVYFLIKIKTQYLQTKQ